MVRQSNAKEQRHFAVVAHQPTNRSAMALINVSVSKDECMPSPKRRMISLGIGAAVALGGSRTWAQTRPKPLRMLLNTSYSGPQAWSLLATNCGCPQVSASGQQKIFQCLSKWVKSRRIIRCHATDGDLLEGNPVTPPFNYHGHGQCVELTIFEERALPRLAFGL